MCNLYISRDVVDGEAYTATCYPLAGAANDGGSCASWDCSCLIYSQNAGSPNTCSCDDAGNAYLSYYAY